jgi:3-oxoadipate CoA-transferase beta subunit
LGCVSRLYTDQAVIDLSDGEATVIDLAPGLTLRDLQALTPGVTLKQA